MKPISIFILFAFLIYCSEQSDCGSTNCKTDGLVCQSKEGSVCPASCKPKYGDTIQCYDCGTSTIANFYQIGDSGCSAIGSCDGSKKIIESSKECSSIDASNINLFHIGNVYYKECPDYTIKISSNECKCANKYYTDNLGIYHCLSPTEKCPSDYNYYMYETGLCTTSCDDSSTSQNKYIKTEGDGQKRCHTSCVGDEFYYKTGSVSDSKFTCTDYCDKLIYIDNSNKKQCIDNCPNNYKKKNNYCVPLAQCQFYDESIEYCLNSCDESGSNPYHKFGSNKCISNCDTNENEYHYLKDNVCYLKNNCNYIQGSNCLSTCNVGEGFIRPEASTSKECHTSCSSTSNSYFNHGDNKCMESCSSNGNNKIYHKNGGNECFSSCKDIDDGTFIYTKIDTNNNDYICYSSIPEECSYYIEINDGIKKCETSCPANYKYLKDKECLEECDDYKAIDNSASPSSSLIKCFLELDSCFNDYKYYNIDEKKCWKELPFGYCIKSNDNNEKIEVIPISDNYYYEVDNEKYCVTSCKEKNKFIDFTDKKKCIGACSKTVGTETKYYYFDPRNNECLETCIGSGLEFAYPAESEAKSCLISNEGKYYFENDKLLKDNCGLYLKKSPGSKICVLSCQPNEKITTNNECTNGCPSTAPYINAENKCKELDNCQFVSEEGNKCLTSCSNSEGFYIAGDNKICYNTCPSSDKYHDLGSNICILKCVSPNNYYIEGDTVCYSSCGIIPAGSNGKYLYETKITESGSSNEYYICSDSIPSNCNYYHIENGIKKCGVDCGEYTFVKGKECLSSCDGYKGEDGETPKKCFTDLDECSANNYIYYNAQTKVCYTEGNLPTDYFIKSIYSQRTEIVTSCSGLLEYEDTDGKKYCYSIEECKSLGKYKSGNACVNGCEDIFIYNSECLDSCGIGTGHDYHNYNSKICISGCSGEYSYYKENDADKVCYSSCDQISVEYKYLRGFICSNIPCQYYHSEVNNIWQCYDNEDECIKAGYSYLNGNKCLATCENYKVKPVKDLNGIITNLGKCFDTAQKCRENGYYFYNKDLKECWFDTCKNNLHIMQLGNDGHPIESGTTNQETCVANCPVDYSQSGNYCISANSCPAFLDNDLSKCVSDCGDKYLIYGTNKCTSSCNTFYFINDSGKKECLDGTNNCKTISKFYFPGTPSKCVAECYKVLDSGLTKYLFYDPSDNKCVESCSTIVDKNFADEPITNHQECKDSCGTKYYYEDEKICRDTSCILFKDNTDGQTKCVTDCGTKKVSDNKCVDSCPNFFVEQKIEIKGEKRIIKKCVNNCHEYSSEYEFIFISPSGEKECLKTCNENFIKIGNLCYVNNCDIANSKKFFNPSDSSCAESCTSGFYEKLSEYPDLYICKSSCDSTQFKHKVGEKSECLSECPSGANYIHENRECKSDVCSSKIVKADKGSYQIYECINNNLCSDGLFYSETNKECYSICKGNDEGNPFSLTIKNNEGNIIERKCGTSCSNPYIYYKEDKICLESCNGLLIEDSTNKCVESCNGIYKYKSDGKCLDTCPDGYKRFVSPNNECMVHCPNDKIYHPSEGVFECISDCKEGEYKEEITVTLADSSTFKEYNCVSNYGNKKYYKTDRILRDQCLPGHYVIEDTHECVENCNLANTDNNVYCYYEYDSATPEDNDYQENTCILRCKVKKPFYKDGHCQKECGSNLYYKDSDKICLPNCPDGYYKNGNICVNSCRAQNKFLNVDGTCVDSCPTGVNENKFYIESDYECIQDCTSENPYYTETTESSGGVTKYKCHGSCDNYYIVNENPNVIAKKCLPNGEVCYPNFYSSEDNEKECYNNCPSNKYFDAVTKKCLSQCQNHKYHEKDSKECKEPKDCTSKIADFESKECVPKCNTAYTSEITDESGNKITICLNACSETEYGTYLTPDNKCVKSCQDDFSANSEVVDNKCKCQHLYYYDEVQKKTICLDKNDENKKDYCFQVEDYSYLIHIYGTEECVKTCDGFLSLNGEFCYKSENEACKSNLFDKNSILMNVEDKRKCDCPYNFYIDSSTLKKKCLSEFDTCTQEYSFYIPETRQCIDSCSNSNYYKKKFKKYCLSSCPIGSTISGDECNCPNYWYSIGNSFHCLGENSFCLDSYPFYAPETKECLKKCKGSYYPYLLDLNRCYTGCDAIEDNSGFTYIDTNNNNYLKKCICNKPWYYQNNEGVPIHCPKVGESTKYCSDYSGKNFNFMIHDTKECVQNCPSDHLYHFNQECFTNCDDDAELTYNYVTQKGSYECQCKNLWYTYEDNGKNFKKCTTFKNICIGNIENKNYLNDNTNECIDTCPQGTFIFNMTCYDKCPTYTVETPSTTDGYTCSCNTDIDGYWYEYKLNEKNFYACGVRTCPISDTEGIINRPFLVEEKKKCVNKCKDDEDYKFSFQYNIRKLCVSECPENTDTDEANKICEFKDLDSADSKEKLINYANVQSLELYEIFGNLGGFLYNKFNDVSLQIYEINKEDTLKEISTKSNLTYIDFDTCLPKIYENNKLKDDDKIIVTKYDLKYWVTNTNSEGNNEKEKEKEKDSEESGNNKFLINRVEYAFYNSRTMKQIRASECDPYEILISYPLVFNKNLYDDYDSGYNNNEYKKKLEMGKKLHEKNNEYDTFNPNNTLYKEFCTGVELYGKDLVYEDRYNILYPNGALLCEPNCTYNSTDFEEERANCKCTNKQEIDFNRVIQEKNDLINDPNFHLPEQSSSNIEVIKCISKLGIKEALVNNEAFYICASVAVVTISMVFVTTFYSLKAVANNISGILNKFIKKGNNDNIIDVNVSKDKNVNKTDNYFNSTNRNLNNPPKKTGETNENDNKNARNIIENKDIAISYNINNSIENENENEDKLDENNSILDIDYNHNAEYLLQQYNFKYFKSSDKGVIKKIERSKLPFKVNQNTKYLVERKNGVTYPINYLKGPFLSSQNIIEIIDKENNENNIKNSNEPNNIRNTGNNDYKSPIKNNQSEKKRNIVNNKLNLNLNMSSYKKDPQSEKKENDFINIKTIKFNKGDKNTANEDYEEEKKDEPDDNAGLYTLIKREQILLRVSYKKYISKKHNNILSIFLAEILDKVYLVKICLFLKKFEIFGVNLSLYLFCHLLLLTLSCLFFTTGTIKKIWEQENYPGIQFYLLYGFISNIVVWVIYKIFLCLLDIQDKIKELVEFKNKNNNQGNPDEIINEINNENIENKSNEVMKILKCKIIIFYCIIFVFIILFTLYLISFFSIYTGTKSLVLKTYIISIIEILIIKLIYGICLASLRIASEGNELICLYKLVYILDKYIS